MCSWSPAFNHNCSLPSWTKGIHSCNNSVKKDCCAPAPPKGMSKRKGFLCSIRWILRSVASGILATIFRGFQCPANSKSVSGTPFFNNSRYKRGPWTKFKAPGTTTNHWGWLSTTKFTTVVKPAATAMAPTKGCVAIMGLERSNPSISDVIMCAVCTCMRKALGPPLDDILAIMRSKPLGNSVRARDPQL